MPFVLIAGTFHLCGQSPAGRATGFEPDGDSCQFKPADPTLLDRLTQVGDPYRLTSIGSTQLRFEGIDALELHFEGSHQPRALGDQSRDFLIGGLGLKASTYRPPGLTRVQPPVQRDAAPGYILSRALEAHGRPVAFAFAATPPSPDGSSIRLTPTLLRKSLNFRSVAAGHAYPLFYDTLFADLRATFTTAASRARGRPAGLWGADRTQKGLKITDQGGLERDGVLFPKLFRRLTEFLGDSPAGMSEFLPWLEAKREQVLDLTTSNFTHLDDVVAVSGDTVTMTKDPENLVFVSAKTSSRRVAPWLVV